MSDAISGVIAFLVIMIVAVLAILFAPAPGAACRALRQEAIEAGVAEWQVDPKTGETSFVWRKCQ